MTSIWITALQRTALEAAAVRNDLTVYPIRSKPALNAGSTAKLVKTLVAKGLAEERLAEGKVPVWRTDNDGRRLAAVISLQGLAAIGVAPPIGKAHRRSRAAGKTDPVAPKQAIVSPGSDNERRVPRAGTKLAVLVDLLGRDGGATIDEMAIETGWQAHSVRGVMSGALQKGFGLEIVSEKVDRGRVYRLRNWRPMCARSTVGVNR
jgi:hypothetical protein